MKRNMDLIRLVLLKIEAKETSAALYASDLQIESYTKEEVAYSCKLLYEAGYVSDYKPFYADNTLCDFGVGSMTWEGQDYLESVRDNTRWGKIKKIAKEKGIPLMFNTVIDISKKLIIAAL